MFLGFLRLVSPRVRCCDRTERKQTLPRDPVFAPKELSRLHTTYDNQLKTFKQGVKKDIGKVVH